MAFDPLTRLFNWSLAYGMPAHLAEPGARWRALETTQRCAETALLAVLSALCRVVPAAEPGSPEPRAVIDVHWENSANPLELLHRIRATSLYPASFALAGLNLFEANLFAANLFGANLGGANLGGATLTGADLGDADLTDADLRKAYLTGANLEEAWLGGANLRGAYLGRANLRRAYLGRANLIGAYIGGSDLQGANLNGANLEGANLKEADLNGAQLDGAILRDLVLTAASLRFVDCQETAHLSDAAIQSAFGVRSGVGRTRLPDGMDYPAHWHQAAKQDVDSLEAERAYAAAYFAWRYRPVGTDTAIL